MEKLEIGNSLNLVRSRINDYDGLIKRDSCYLAKDVGSPFDNLLNCYVFTGYHNTLSMRNWEVKPLGRLIIKKVK